VILDHEVRGVHQVFQEQQVTQDLLALVDQLAALDFLAPMDKLEMMDHRVQLDLQECVAQGVYLVVTALQVVRGTRVHLVKTVTQEHLVTVGTMVLLDLMVSRDPLEEMVDEDLQVCKDQQVLGVHEVFQVEMVAQENQGRLDQVELLDHPDHLDQMVIPEKWEQTVQLVLMVHLEMMESQVHLVVLGRLDQLVDQGRRATVVDQVHLVLLVHLVFQDKARLSTNQTSRVLASLTAEASFSQKTAEPSLEDSLMLRRG
jgi:hypothetical protein